MEYMVSVIIPVYNVKNYLIRCVASVLNQTYKELEIILVDDGSTDGSSILCDSLKKKDNRIVVTHKANGGLSDARNVGTAVAKGDFVFYLDSDDFIDENAIEELVKFQKNSNCELVISNYYYTYKDREVVAKFEFKDHTILDKTEAMEALVTGKIQNFAWGKLINREIALNCKFPYGRLFEDVFWFHNILNECSKVAIVNRAIVHYYQRSDSISFGFNVSNLDILDGFKERKNFLDEKYPNLVEMYLQFVSKQFINLSWFVITKLKKNKKNAFDKLTKFASETNLINYFDEHNKKVVSLLFVSPFLFSLRMIIDKIINLLWG